MRVIHLNEVEVTAPRIERRDESRLRFPLNEGSDRTLRRDVFEKVHLRFVSDYLTQHVPGLRVIKGAFGNHIYFTSAGAFNPAATSPLIIVDGIAWLGNALDQFSPADIESIDVFNGPSAAIFGARGSFGVISVTTRRGLNDIDFDKNVFNCTVYKPLGYQKPIEFYAPKYETLESKHLTIPDYRTTIFWKPDIVVADDGKASFDFYTSDYPTTYSVVIEGLTTDGRIVRQVEKIRVE
jgi:TonB-dependent SusC/RagA subfamily outer membrane receptor